MRRAAAVVLLALSCALAGAVRAQTPQQRLEAATRAYGNLDYDAAAAALHAALAQTGPQALNDRDRVRALTYLGATELYRNNRDSALAAFRRILRIDPRSRPDELVFPPEVTGLFQEARLDTRIVTIAAPPVTRIQAAGDRLVLWLYATSYHQIDVAVLRSNGVPLRALYQGSIGDSLQLLWDGQDSTRAPAETGAYVLRVDSRGSDGRVVRSVEVPLDIQQSPGDTLPLPPAPADSLFRPERTKPNSGVRALASGLLVAAAAAALPTLISGKSDGMSSRFLVSGVLGVSAIVGFRLQRQPQLIPENAAANQALRLAWQRRVDEVHRANETRKQQVRLLVRAGTPLTTSAP